MLPAPNQILTCPFCSQKKEIMSLMSGNTFRSELWSDNKMIAPMLPEVSFIQKCPHCGKYYIKDRQKAKYANDTYGGEQGLLTFFEMKEAFAQLAEEGFLNNNEEAQVRMMLHHAYNDYYYRCNREDDIAVNDEDKSLFHENALWLIYHHITDNLMKGEFFREIGELEIAKNLLDSVVVEDNFAINILSSIRERLERNDCKVFKIR